MATIAASITDIVGWAGVEPASFGTPVSLTDVSEVVASCVDDVSCPASVLDEVLSSEPQATTPVKKPIRRVRCISDRLT